MGELNEKRMILMIELVLLYTLGFWINTLCGTNVGNMASTKSVDFFETSLLATPKLEEKGLRTACVDLL